MRRIGLSSEYNVFLSHPHNMRVLLITNFIYAFVLPVIDIFVAAYVMRNSNDVRMVMSYQLALFTGIPFTFYLNGYLLRVFSIKWLYSLGMLLSGFSMAAMMSLKTLDIYGIAATGLLMGMSFGLFWANRDYLALSSTTDENRNYYYGIETFFSTLCGLIVPISVGWFIASTELYGWLSGSRNNAYLVVTAALIVLSLVASVVLQRGKFSNPEPTRFVYWKYDPLWSKVLWMAVFRGVGQGFMATAPAMLVMELMGGKEGVLGILQTVGAIVTAVTFYLIGRLTRPSHRIWILLAGLILYAGGAAGNAILFSALGVVIFIGCQLVGRPLIENAFFPIQMLVIDLLSRKEKRNSFAYIFNHEFALYGGRMAGGLLFIIVATYISQNVALRYVLVIIGLLQIVTFFICRSILRTCQAADPILVEEDMDQSPHSTAELMSSTQR